MVDNGECRLPAFGRFSGQEDGSETAIDFVRTRLIRPVQKVGVAAHALMGVFCTVVIFPGGRDIPVWHR